MNPESNDNANVNRARSQIYTRGAEIKLNHRRLLDKYYYRQQRNKEDQSEDATTLNYIPGLRRPVRNPESYTFVQALTSQVGLFAIQSRVLDDPDAPGMTFFDPDNFKKLAAVLEILLADALNRSGDL